MVQSAFQLLSVTLSLVALFLPTEASNSAILPARTSEQIIHKRNPIVSLKRRSAPRTNPCDAGPQPPACLRTVTSTPGETCVSLAASYGMTVAEVVLANPTINCADIDSGTSICITTPEPAICRIRVDRSSDNTPVGWLKNGVGSFLLPTFTESIEDANTYTIESSGAGGPSALRIKNFSNTQYQYLGPYFGTANYNILAEVNYNPAYAMQQNPGSSRSTASAAESTVWYLNPVTNELTITWVTLASSQIPNPLFFLPSGSGPVGYFISASTPGGLSSTFPTAFAVQFIYDCE